jgi:hypothetical protein
MAWRLMWHPGSAKDIFLDHVAVSMHSAEVATEAESRMLVRQLRTEGISLINVTMAGSKKILSGAELKRWLDPVGVKPWRG